MAHADLLPAIERLQQLSCAGAPPEAILRAAAAGLLAAAGARAAAAHLAGAGSTADAATAGAPAPALLTALARQHAAPSAWPLPPEVADGLLIITAPVTHRGRLIATAGMAFDASDAGAPARAEACAPLTRALAVSLVALADDPATVSALQRRLVQLYRVTTSLIYLYDLAADRLLDINPMASELLGYPLDELLSTPLRTLVHPDDQDDFYGDQVRAAADGEVLDTEFRVRTRDGDWTLLRAREVVFRRGPAGEPLVLLGLAQDVTAERRGDELLHMREQEFRELVENAPDVIARYDRDLRHIYANPAIERATGIPAGEFMGRTFGDLALPHDLVARWVALLRQVFETGEGRAVEYDYPTPGGPRRYHTRLTPERARDGSVVSVLTITRDITLIRQAEEARLAAERQAEEARRLEGLGVMAGGLAHDFNNLLVAILGHASLAHDALSPESPARHSIVEIEGAARRASELTQRLLAYAGQSQTVQRDLDLSALVAGLAAPLADAVAGRAALRLALGDGLPPVRADAGQLRQVVVNLVANAAEASEGSPESEVRVATAAEHMDRERLDALQFGSGLAEGPYVTLTVSDAGHGMDEPTLRRIFDPFFTTRFPGRGLGLAAVQGIVRAHRGALRVLSRPGQGATFQIVLPASDAQELAARPARRDQGRRAACVLLIDDEPEVRTVGVRMLERLGYRAATAASGDEGVALLRAQPGAVDCVLLDTTMPHMNGEETLAEIRQVAPRVPVLMISGYSQRAVADRLRERQPDGFLQKPFTLGDLRVALAELLAP